MEENRYSVKDLCNIFNIKQNTFPSVARRLNIDTDEFCTMELNEYNSPKKYYNEMAYKKVEGYALAKQKKQVLKDVEVGKYLQKIEDKEKIIADLRKQLDFTQKLLVTEKGEKQQMQQQINLLAEDNKKISELEMENKTLATRNETFIKENQDLQEDKFKLEKEVERLNNRGLFARLFNK